MNVLGFDTATAATVVGLLADGLDEPLAAEDLPAPGERPRHARQLLVLARGLLECAGLRFADVDRVAVGVGPGSFTGVRIGVATARALAQSSGAQLAGVSTLRALAVPAEEAHPGAVALAVVDARRGEVFAAAWRDGRPVLEAQALSPEALAERVSARGRADGETWLAVGDGAVRFSGQLLPAGVTIPAPGSPLHRVSAGVVCRLGAQADPVPRTALVPEYLRAPDAKPAARPIAP